MPDEGTLHRIALATGSVREILDWLDRNQDDRKETARVSGFAHHA